jgi:hypothetical protein
MKFAKDKTATAIALFLMLTMAVSLVALPTVNAHEPAWEIPTYAYVFAAPNPIGVGQSLEVFAWLDPCFGAAGGRNAIPGTSGYTASVALTSNNYRFHNYKVVITAPDGKTETKTWDTVWDPTSCVEFRFTPDQVGTYTFEFIFPGQDYDQYDHYADSILVNDTYLLSSASTTLTVQDEPIPAAVGSAPLPTEYWTRPIYGEGTDWCRISSDWLGSGSPQAAGYTSSNVYHGDSIGPLTAHIMWTKPIQAGGVVGGNLYTDAPGVGYFEGSCYIGRFSSRGGQALIVDGLLFYPGVVGMTGGTSGPYNCVNLRTGELVWSSDDVSGISFAYVYNLWNGEQHGVFQPILFSNNFAQAYDAWTGTPLFNVTNVPSGTAVAGPSGEQLRYVFVNAGTATNPKWYLAQWNSSKLWQYDVNPYTFGGSLSPSLVNASNGALISSSGIPITKVGTTATLPPTSPGAPAQTIAVPYGSSVTVNADIPINSTTVYPTNLGPQTTYDWNVSVPWLNTMPLLPSVDGFGVVHPGIPGSNPCTVVAANTGDVMLCRNGSLPTGFSATSAGWPQLPYTFFTVNLNASRGPIGSIIWMKTYDPPAGNLTVSFHGVDWQTRTFVMGYIETINKVGYSLTTGEQLWGPTEPMVALEYYERGYGIAGALAYGNAYFDGMGGVCYCYDCLTGELEWTYGNGGEGNSTYSLDSPYGEYPTYVGPISGNGVLYLMSNEHTVTNPIYKGAQVRALNATTGKEIWTLSCYGSMVTPILADGFATFFNGYDSQIYTVGRGPSATTVTASPKVSAHSDSVLVEGSVIDTAAGTKQEEQAARFPNGVPAISDASMTDWMGYVYQQKPLPADAVGVNVTISVLDPNNNYYEVATATSDKNGFYSATFVPQVPGKYTIIATFAGTNGYWPSQAETAINVEEAPVTTVQPTPPSSSIADLYLVPGIVGIIIAIAVVGAVLVLMLRKR